MVELMIVVAIIGILASVAVPAFADYMKKSKATEPVLQLNAIGKLQKRAFGENGSYTMTDGAQLPLAGGTCCGQPNNKCAAQPALFRADAGWNAMGFSVGEESFFAYSFKKGTTTSFTAYAEGDTDCNGVHAIYTLTGSFDAASNPSLKLTKPAAGVY